MLHHRAAHCRRTALCAALAGLLFLLGPAFAEPAGETSKRTPVPGKASQAKAEALIHELYQSEFTAAKKDPLARGRLAVILLQEGRDTTDDLTARYVLFREASELAAQAGDAPTALQALEEIAASYAVAEPELFARKVEALGQASTSLSSPDAYQTVVDAALVLLEEALAQDNYEEARRLVSTAETAAIKVRSVPLVSSIRKRNEEVTRLEKEYAKVKPFVDALRQNPKDPKANEEVGRYQALVKGNWEKGLPLLAHSAHPDLKRAADADLAQPEDPVKQIRVAQHWNRVWTERRDQLREPERLQIFLRIYHWYQQAAPRLQGEQRRYAQESLRGILAAIPPEYHVGEIVAQVRRFEGHTAPVYGVALSPDGHRAVTGSRDQTVRVWDTRSGKEVRRCDGHTDTVWAVAFSPDGRRVLSGSFDKSIRLWELASGRDVRRFEGHEDYVRSVAFTPNGRHIVSGGDDRTLRLWDADTGKLVRTLKGHNHYVMSVAVSPDGKHAASASLDRSVRVWDLESGSELQRFDGHKDTVLTVAFTPDGRRVLSGGSDKTLRLWDTQTGKELAVLKGQQGYVLSVAVSPDGGRALSAGQDGTLRLWDLNGGRELRTLEGHSGRVWSVVFARDGRLALSGGDDGTARLWGGAK